MHTIIQDRIRNAKYKFDTIENAFANPNVTNIDTRNRYDYQMDDDFEFISKLFEETKNSESE